MRTLLIRVTVVLVSLAVSLLLAELALRAVAKPNDHGALYYASEQYEEIDLDTPEGLARAVEYVEVVEDAPRFRMNFKPNVVARLCYRGMAGEAGFDDHGCLTFEINSRSIREREELCEPKPPGQTRVLCLGDSTTVGWGVAIEDAWTRRVEAELREADDGIRLVNAGAAGTLHPEEYAWALRRRFAVFDPDAVLVTMCLNDLLPINGGMSHMDPDAIAARNAPLPSLVETSALATAVVRNLLRADPLDLDPERDWVGELLAQPMAERPDWAQQAGPVLWADGTPQTALLEMRDWCRERDLPFGVALWPTLQQLEDPDRHPFTSMHERVAAFCAEHEIPFLDLLDPFLGLDASELWVTRKDMHGNARAHAIATPAYVEFVRGLLRG